MFVFDNATSLGSTCSRSNSISYIGKKLIFIESPSIKKIFISIGYSNSGKGFYRKIES
jgi:hypothetical protein